MHNIIELNELIHAGAKQVRDEIGTPQGNFNRNIKLGWEMKLAGKTKKLW